MFARQYSDKITDNNVMDGVPYTLYSEDGVFMVKSVNILRIEFEINYIWKGIIN